MRLGTHNVILEMLSDTRKLDVNGNAGSVQNILRTNSTVHKYMRATNCATSQDNFLSDINGLLCSTPGSGKLDARSCQVVFGR